ncbi:MAG: DUF11 domain-containing protein [Thermoleophilia bacterium]|nr:DUF11 domain-containing protein [Thermoleophilia bacterium]
MKRHHRNRPTTRRRFPLSILLGILSLAALAFAASGAAAPAGTTDLAISKSDSPDPVRVGSTLTYTIGVENRGPLAATGVTVTDTLPKGVDFASASPGCTQKARKITCPLGDIPFGGVNYSGAAKVTIAVIPRQAGTITNTASVNGDQKDPVAANNSASVSTRVLGAATCRRLTATITGTPGDDVLVGTGGPDVLVALGGNDTIRTGAGRDLICAGAGNDFVVGGSAGDRVFASAGSDRLLGRGGPDLLKAGAGNDVLKGGLGSDRLRGGSGSDRCRGGAGMDSIRGCER